MNRFLVSFTTLLFSFSVCAMELVPTTTLPVVASGVKTRIGFSFHLNPDCSEAGPVIVRVLLEPKNGKFESLDEEGHSSYSKDSALFKCNAEKRVISKYYYTSSEGFIGKDKVVIDTFFSNGNSRKRTFDITVK